ncbi:MAG: rhomboid family intramembrane serine protease [Geminicoccales bacterium]
MADDPTTDLVEVSRPGSRADAEQQALVLAAVGISSRLVMAEGAAALYVSPLEAARARYELCCYARENALPRRSLLPTVAALHWLEGALAYCAVLLFFFAAGRRDALSVDWVAAGAAQAGLIQGGAWWRALTALCLHVDLDHLMSNLAFGAVAGVLVAQLLGTGLGWLVILLAGAIGNALNAALHGAGHTAIGASTAVFGALGILSGHAWTSRAVRWRGGIRRWAPIGAGIMLLAFLGFGGERTDVGAHVAGFVVGAAAGFVLARAGHLLPHAARAQQVYGAIACGLLSLAWLMALRVAA